MSILTREEIVDLVSPNGMLSPKAMCDIYSSHESLRAENNKLRHELGELTKEVISLRKLSGNRPKSLEKAHYMIDKLRESNRELSGTKTYDGHVTYDELRAQVAEQETAIRSALDCEQSMCGECVDDLVAALARHEEDLPKWTASQAEVDDAFKNGGAK